MRFHLFVFCSLLYSSFSVAQQKRDTSTIIKENYQFVYNELDKMLDNKTPLRFGKAVFLTENAYVDNVMDSSELKKSIKSLAELCRNYMEVNSLNYEQKDKETVQKWAAIFKVITDTIPILINNKRFCHLPFRYDFDDFFAEKDWSKMFVSKLLIEWMGNCHSMPYLYKIIAEELGVTANLALAPNHIYIKHKSLKDGWYNTELTSATFPIDAWVMASGYIHLTAIQNGVYMKALDDKESIALCLIDLAEGYKRKTNNADPDFILKCCDKALEYFPNYVNAMILKAETIKSQYDKLIKENPNPTNEEKERLQKLFKEMQDLYVKVHTLGYRQMPKDMYMKWLMELKTEKGKYLNKNVSTFDRK